MNNKLLFYGEIYPFTTNGISIFNKEALNILGEKFIITKIIKKGSGESHPSLISTFKSLLNYFYSLSKFDLLYISIPTSFKGMLLLYIQSFYFNRKNFKSIIYHIHRGDLEHFIKFKINRCLFKKLTFFAKKIIVLDYSQSQIIKNLNPTIEVKVLNNTCFENFDVKYNSVEGKFLFLSNYFKEKGILDAIEVFNKLNNKSLVCFGNGKIPKEVRINKNIIINDSLHGKEKFMAYSNCDALIFPSWNEGFPLTILESMSIGTPIICSKVGYIEKILGSKYPLFFQPRNTIQLKEKIIEFEQMDKKKISKYLINRYNKYFHKSIFKKSLNEIFDNS